jgi:hypothetical protein
VVGFISDNDSSLVIGDIRLRWKNIILDWMDVATVGSADPNFSQVHGRGFFKHDIDSIQQKLVLKTFGGRDTDGHEIQGHER